GAFVCDERSQQSVDHNLHADRRPRHNRLSAYGHPANESVPVAGGGPHKITSGFLLVRLTAMTPAFTLMSRQPWPKPTRRRPSPQCLDGGPSIWRRCGFPKAWFRYGSSSTSQSRFMVCRLVCEWSEVTRSTARNANAKNVSLLRSNADRIACERTSSRNRNTVAASVRLCAGGRFWLRRFCATLMASTIMRSELIGTKTRRSQQRSNPGSLVFKTFGFNIMQSFPTKFTSALKPSGACFA